MSLLAVFIFGINPATVYLYTNVLSESLYLLLTLLVFWLWPKIDAKKDRIKIFALTLTLALIPLTRVIGLSLLAALFIGSIKRSFSKIHFRIIIISAIPGLIMLARLVYGYRQSYITNFFLKDPLSENLLIQRLILSVNSLFFYLKNLIFFAFPFNNRIISPEVLMKPELSYSPLPFPAFEWVSWTISLAIFLFAVAGVIADWKNMGKLYAGYAFIYLTTISVYTNLDDRLVFPLLPQILIYSFLGIKNLKTYLKKMGFLEYIPRKLLSPLFGIFIFLFLTPSLLWAKGSLQENLEFLFHKESFAKKLATAPLAPDKYQLRWDLAGRWLSKNTAPDDVIIGNKLLYVFSSRKTVFSHLFQEDILTLNAKIKQSYPVYIAVPDESGIQSNNPIFTRNPLYRFETIYSAEGVQILKARINEKGVVEEAPPSYEKWVELLKRKPGKTADKLPSMRLLGILYFQNGDFKKAAEIFQKLSSYPMMRNANLLRLLGDAYLSLGDADKALLSYREGLFEPHSELESYDLKLGIEMAKFKKAAKKNSSTEDQKFIDKSKAEKYMEWGANNFRWGMHRYALESFEKARKIIPEDPQIYRMLGFTYEIINDKEKAATAYKEGFLLNDSYCKENYIKLETAKSLDMPGKKIGILNLPDGSAKPVIPFEAETYLRLAETYSQNTQYPAAIHYLKEGVKIAPREPRLYISLGKNYEALGDNKTALLHYAKALAEDPENIPLRAHSDTLKKTLRNTK